MQFLLKKGRDDNESKNNWDASDDESSTIEKEDSAKNENGFLKKYNFFIRSPRVHFFYDTLLFLLFLVLFSFTLLCKFNYCDYTVFKEINGRENSTDSNQASFFKIHKLKNEALIDFTYECLLFIWVLLLFLQEIDQVIFF